MPSPKIVARDAWLEARKALLAEEKALTRAKDTVNRHRLAMPWVRLEKRYVFEDASGPVSLADLFEGRSQLLIYHFMFGPGWSEGCSGCSFLCDHVDSARRHFEHHDVSFAAVSRAPFATLESFRLRMGWSFRWVSAFASDFNTDFNVSFTPEQMEHGGAEYNFAKTRPDSDELSGVSAFYRDEAGRIFHTYSQYARGGEEVIGTYGWLDVAPLGRNETGPSHDLSDWVRHHDRYETLIEAAACPACATR